MNNDLQLKLSEFCPRRNDSSCIINVLKKKKSIMSSYNKQKGEGLTDYIILDLFQKYFLRYNKIFN